MKTTFEEIIDIVLEHEGGYVNDPDDAGGETNYGIAKRWYPNVDIKNLTKEEAKKIYHMDYWNPAKCNEVPKHLRHIYFDMCVNFGRSGAVKVLQQAANSKIRNKIDINVKKIIPDSLKVDANCFEISEPRKAPSDPPAAITPKTFAAPSPLNKLIITTQKIETTKSIFNSQPSTSTVVNFLKAIKIKAMKSSPLLGPFWGSEFWRFSLLKI